MHTYTHRALECLYVCVGVEDTCDSLGPWVLPYLPGSLRNQLNTFSCLQKSNFREIGVAVFMWDINQNRLPSTLPSETLFMTGGPVPRPSLLLTAELVIIALT
jgi:hypothetical protein